VVARPCQGCSHARTTDVHAGIMCTCQDHLLPCMSTECLSCNMSMLPWTICDKLHAKRQLHAKPFTFRGPAHDRMTKHTCEGTAGLRTEREEQERSSQALTSYHQQSSVGGMLTCNRRCTLVHSTSQQTSSSTQAGTSPRVHGA
jgi:hypothetical protein